MKNEISYFSPLRIPEGRSGKFYIKHDLRKAGEKLPVVTARDAIFQGKGQSHYVLKTDMIIHRLCEGKSYDGGDGTWMSDCPQEIWSQKEIVDRAFGDVLVGGLGLGYIAKAINDSDAVRSVTVVERSKDVIKLVWKHLDVSKVRLVEDDLFKYLKRVKNKRRFDWAFYDIWAPTGESVLDEFIRPLRKASIGVIDGYTNDAEGRVLCWEEATMLGQIKFHLAMDIETWNMEGPLTRYKTIEAEKWNSKHMHDALRTQWAFLNWMRETSPTKDEAMKALDRYVRDFSFIDKWNSEWARWNKPVPQKKRG